MKPTRFLVLLLSGFILSALPIVLFASGRAGASGELKPAAPALGNMLVTGSLIQPVHITHAGDGSGRLFIVERAGRIRIYQDDALLDQPFLDISGRVLSADSEQGLLSVAFPPGFILKKYFYVYYTDLLGDTVVSRYYVRGDPNQADPASEQIILQQDQPYPNHNGGQLRFGPDGYLYISLGDGGSGFDPDQNGQDTSTLLGKILRIDVEPDYPEPIAQPARVFIPQLLTSPDKLAPPAYTIPADNPFVGQAGYREEIWALGLRNPWRFSFDRLTGDLYIGDVGQSNWEEIDYQPANSPGGENYGWRCYEGDQALYPDECTGLSLTFPVSTYSHDFGCSVTGGFVYRGAAVTELSGKYIFADFCSGSFWSLEKQGLDWLSSPLPDTDYRPTSFGEDEAGELYFTNYSAGEIYRFVASFLE